MYIMKCELSFVLNLIFLQVLTASIEKKSLTTTQVTMVGSSASLPCTYENINGLTYWLRKDPSLNGVFTVIFLADISNVNDERFSVIFNHPQKPYTLQIKDTRSSDFGIYRCESALESGKKIWIDIQLIVLVPSVIFDNSTGTVMVTEGSGTRLECFADGFPAPRISWRRQNNELFATGESIRKGKTLHLTRISEDDVGKYICRAENGIANGTERTFKILMESAPHITVNTPRIGRVLNNEVELTCLIEAYPPPTMYWIKDDKLITTEYHYKLTVDKKEVGVYNFTLRIDSTEKHLYGNYTCKARNKLGSSEATFQLFELVSSSECNRNNKLVTSSIEKFTNSIVDRIATEMSSAMTKLEERIRQLEERNEKFASILENLSKKIESKN